MNNFINNIEQIPNKTLTENKIYVILITSVH